MKKTSINKDDRSVVKMENEGHLNYDLRLFINCNGEPGAFGPGVAALLRGIEQYGSLAKAAQSMGMAYSKAWKSMRKIESYLGFQLIIRQTGRGYGSNLTPKGEDFLRRYEAFVKQSNDAVAKLFVEIFEGI